MKRNLYCILMVLFILSACVPIPEGLDQAATVTQIPTKYASPWLTFPAPLPNETGETVEIPSSNYPDSSKNFILDDTRSNEKKLEVIKVLAPDDYQKEIDLYKAEIKRMGFEEKDFEYVASVFNKKSWVIAPKNLKTGEIYVPSINNLIQASLHLFGYLDKTPEDDFFDLIPINIPNATVIGDKSGWHIVVQKSDDSISKWYDAKYDKIQTVEAEPTPTPETYLGIQIETDPTTPYEKLPVVTYEDFETGKILKAEKEYLKTHNIFTGNEIWPEEFFSTKTIFGYGRKIQIVTNYIDKYYNDNSLLPTKATFFYRTDMPKNFLLTWSGKIEYILVGQVWLNPLSESDLPEDKYRVIHHLFEKRSLDIPGITNEKFVPLTIVSYDAEKVVQEIEWLSMDQAITVGLINNYYHDDSPYKYVQEWIDTGIIPPETEDYMFPGWGHIF